MASLAGLIYLCTEQVLEQVPPLQPGTSPRQSCGHSFLGISWTTRVWWGLRAHRGARRCELVWKALGRASIKSSTDLDSSNPNH